MSKDLNKNVFNTIIKKNKETKLTKDISRKSRCRFDEKKCYSDQWWNNNKCPCEYKKHHGCEKDYIWNTTTCSYQNRKYLASVTDDSVITCDEVIES